MEITEEIRRPKTIEQMVANGNGVLTDEQVASLATERREKRVADCTAEYNEAVSEIMARYRCRQRLGLVIWNDGRMETVVQIVAEE